MNLIAAHTPGIARALASGQPPGQFVATGPAGERVGRSGDSRAGQGHSRIGDERAAAAPVDSK